MTLDEFKAIWTVLCLAYPTWSRENSAEMMAQTLRLYYRLLRDTPAEVLEAAAIQHVATSRFFPTIAELRETVLTLSAPPTPPAMAAWGELREALADSRYYRYQDGYHESPKFANPVLQQVVDAMGFGVLQLSEDQVADRARFIQAYETFARRAREDALMLPQVRSVAQRLRGASPPCLTASARRVQHS